MTRRVSHPGVAATRGQRRSNPLTNVPGRAYDRRVGLRDNFILQSGTRAMRSTRSAREQSRREQRLQRADVRGLPQAEILRSGRRRSYTRRRKSLELQVPVANVDAETNHVYFNRDIALEQINMTIIKENSRLMDYLAEYGCEIIAADTIIARLDSAMRATLTARCATVPNSWRCRNRRSDT